MSTKKKAKKANDVVAAVRRCGPVRVVGYVINLFDGDNYYWTGKKFLNKPDLAKIYTSRQSVMATRAALSRYLVPKKQLLFVLGRCA